MKRIIAIIAETDDESIKPATRELISLAQSLDLPRQPSITVIISGSSIERKARTVAEMTGCSVIAIDNPLCTEYNPELYLDIVTPAIGNLKPDLVMAAHSSTGYDLAPAVAARMGVDCITAVEKLRVEQETLTATRSVFNGKLCMDVVVEKGSIITVQPGSHRVTEHECAEAGTVTLIHNLEQPTNIFYRGKTASADSDNDITAADVIVAAGKGIGKKENLELIRRFASIFSRSAVGASRSICDLGWMEYRNQIGMTGKTVSPKLYIACGISGSPQHIAGMKNSGVIVAINNDPDAAIFSVADYGIVEDLTLFIPLVMDEVKK